MKRLLIIEVELSKQCPYQDQVDRYKDSTRKTCKFTCVRACSDENCPLPKVDGGNKRLLMAEVDPNEPWPAELMCPYESFSRDCHHPHPLYSSPFGECSGNNPPFRECSDDNCPLPQIEPNKEEET
jgi:hypothetical protein